MTSIYLLSLLLSVVIAFFETYEFSSVRRRWLGKKSFYLLFFRDPIVQWSLLQLKTKLVLVSCTFAGSSCITIFVLRGDSTLTYLCTLIFFEFSRS